MEKTDILSQMELRLMQNEITLAHDNHTQRLLRHALYKTSDYEVSQDLVQTTFLKTMMYLRRGGKIELMRSFLNHVLNDLIVDEYRYRNNKTSSLDALMKNGFEPSHSTSERDINIIDGKRIVLLLPHLPKKYEVILRLRFLKGLSITEISLVTGQTKNTVAVQVHRGLAKLKVISEPRVFDETQTHTKTRD